MNWMSILGLCLIVLGTIFSFFGTYLSDKQGQEELTVKIQEKNKTIDDISNNNARLIAQNTSLLSSNDQVSETNKDLINQNKGMLDRIGKYQTDIEDRNKRIATLEGEINNVKEYSYYATLDIYGRDFIPGTGIKYSSDLSNRMEKVVIVKDGQSFIRNDKANLIVLDGVIEKYPNFPFGYFGKAIILKAFNDITWKIFAKKAIEIFEITTSIKGHNSSHDEALKILKGYVATNK